MKALQAYTLAILVLASNLGISFSTHYCCGKAVLSSITFANQELACGMPAFTDVEEDLDGVCLYGTPCCETVRSLFDVADHYQLVLGFEILAIPALISDIQDVDLPLATTILPHFEYDRGPPLKVGEYLSLIQVYII